MKINRFFLLPDTGRKHNPHRNAYANPTPVNFL